MKNNGAPRLGCVVMAAGRASRFGANKLTAAVDGVSLIRRALDAVPADRLSAVAVVTGYDAVAAEAARSGFAVVRNDCPDAGVSRTVRLGVEALEKDCDAILFLVADQPLLRRDTVAKVADTWRAHPDCIAGAAAGGVRGNPCIFPAAFFPELKALTGDTGGSAVIRRHPEAVVLVEAPAEQLTDVDTPEALAALGKASDSN